jgi:hypothetical protein
VPRREACQWTTRLMASTSTVPVKGIGSDTSSLESKKKRDHTTCSPCLQPIQRGVAQSLWSSITPSVHRARLDQRANPAQPPCQPISFQAPYSLVPLMFGRNLQCQLVRGVSTREKCYWPHAWQRFKSRRGIQWHPRS